MTALGVLEPAQTKRINSQVEILARALQTARKRIDIGRDAGLSATFIGAAEVTYSQLLGRLDGLQGEASLVDDARELGIWLDRADLLAADIEFFNEELVQNVPGELSKRNWRVAGYVVGGTVVTASVLWVLWWVSKTWWVGRR